MLGIFLIVLSVDLPLKNMFGEYYESKCSVKVSGRNNDIVVFSVNIFCAC
jgi:hypothetical protein